LWADFLADFLVACSIMVAFIPLGAR